MDGLKAARQLISIALGGPQDHDSSVEKHFQKWSAELQFTRPSPLRCMAKMNCHPDQSEIRFRGWKIRVLTQTP
jgi:hypothetical protein